jgi:hypothetical protein
VLRNDARNVHLVAVGHQNRRRAASDPSDLGSLIAAFQGLRPENVHGVFDAFYTMSQQHGHGANNLSLYRRRPRRTSVSEWARAAGALI